MGAWNFTGSRLSHGALATALAIAGGAVPTMASAQTAASPQGETGGEAGSASDRRQSLADVYDEIVVTARKRGEENVQDVPIAVTAYSEKALESLNFRDLASLSYTMPNVALDDIGTMKGVANFSIRGVGINSSIASIDPAVGLFIDGVYMGSNSGIVLDNFDVEGIEVLRGPQGVLFGRNVTGGAVLVRTTTPKDHLEANARVSYETGDHFTYSGKVSGPLIDGTLNAKLAVYHSNDGGWFKNLFDDSQFGKSKQTVVRGALAFTPTQDLKFVLRLEHGESKSDGPAGQSDALFDRNSFDFSVDNRGFVTNNWDQAILQTDLNVGFGDGVITNITAFRQLDGGFSLDGDATPSPGFVGEGVSTQKQWSSELRYAGKFGPLDVTVGGYWFSQTLFSIETRTLLGGLVNTQGGGNGEFSTWGGFASLDYHLTDTFTVNAGVRYTEEKKKADISVIRAGGGSLADATLNYNVPGLHDSWNDISPRIGFQWKPNGATQLYGYWAKGFRSGGINFRNTDAALTPNIFDSEDQSTFEIGLKSDFAGDRIRLNLALFQNKIGGVQREITTPGPLGFAQLIRNVGDATIKGAEAEARLKLSDNLILSFVGGYLHGKYQSLIFDLNGQGGITPADYALKIPRLAPWTYGATLVWNTDVGTLGSLSTRLGYNHRDGSAFTDDNRGYLNGADMIDANLTFTPMGSGFSLSVYGRNLLDEVTHGGDAQLPDSPIFGGDGTGPKRPPSFSPLNKGRVIGVSLGYRF